MKLPPVFGEINECKTSSEFEGFPLQSGIVWVGVIFWEKMTPGVLASNP